MDLIPVTRPAPHPLAQRIGDSERSAACDELSNHFAAGRLTDEELDGRLAATMAARTTHELLLVLGDLPRPTAPAAADRPSGTTSPGGASVLEVLCVVAIVLGTLFAGGLLLVLGAYEFGFFLAALAGGTATAVVGGSIVHLAHRLHDRSRSLRTPGR